jgi:hypothetical protein
MGDRDSNIDLLFRNGLSNYEALPPQDLWNDIKPLIATPRRSFVSLRAAAAIAVLMASGILTAFLVRNIPAVNEVAPVAVNNLTPMGRVPERNNTIPSGPAASMKLAQAEPGQSLPGNVEPEESAIAYYTLPEPGLYTPFIRNSEVVENDRNNLPRSLAQAYNPSYSDMTSEAEVRAVDNVPASNNRWSVAAMVTPAYYSHFGQSVEGEETDLISSEEGAFSYTGGLAFAYNLNSRFTIQSGINYSSIGQKIDGVKSYSGFARYVTSKGVSVFRVRTSSGTIFENNSDIFLADNNQGSRVISYYTREVFDPVKNELSYISNSITQNFNYLELPFLLKYKVIDRGVDLKVIGGFSYNILVNNSAYTTSEGTRYIIGKTEGLSPVTFSSSLGMGMEYNFSGSLSLSIEPTFRYYITSPDGMVGSSIHPYSFGILSGIFYKF